MRWWGLALLALVLRVEGVGAQPDGAPASPSPGRPVMLQVGSIAEAVGRLTDLEAYAVEPGEGLSLAAVVEATLAHHPLVAASIAELSKAEGRARSADAAYDPRLGAKGKWVPIGEKDYGHLGVELRQLTPLWGAEVFTGWRRSGGSVPLYYGELETVPRGEAVVGLAVPLWQDGPIDAARAGVRRTALGRTSAELGLDALRLELAFAASRTYWEWVAAVHRQRVQRKMLQIAEARESQLEARVRSGALAPIELADARRMILERQSALVDAGRTAQEAALRLSLFWRGPDGKPRLAPPAEVPRGFPTASARRGLDPEVDVRSAEAARPDVQRLRVALQDLDVAIELAQNRVAPRVDVVVAGVQPLARRPEDLASTELEAGLTFSLPLGLREARGSRDAIEAERRAITARLQLAREQVRQEVSDAWSALTAAEQQAELVYQELGVALEIMAAERERLALGAGTVLVVNLREQAAADAARRLVIALANLQLARARYLVIIGQMPVDLSAPLE